MRSTNNNKYIKWELELKYKLKGLKIEMQRKGMLKVMKEWYLRKYNA